MSLPTHSSRKVIHLTAKVNCLPLLLIRTGALIHRLLVRVTHMENTTWATTLNPFLSTLPSTPSVYSVVTRVIHRRLGSNLVIVVFLY